MDEAMPGTDQCGTGLCSDLCAESRRFFQTRSNVKLSNTMTTIAMAVAGSSTTS